MEVPKFGEKVKNQTYETRNGAYVIVARNKNQEILLVQAPNGAFFLPGGEIEQGETKEETIHREVLEELGFEIKLGSYLGEAIDYFYSRHRKTYYYHPAHFYTSISWLKKGTPIEDFNQLIWFKISEAKGKLKRGSHRWAITEWQKIIK